MNAELAAMVFVLSTSGSGEWWHSQVNSTSESDVPASCTAATAAGPVGSVVLPHVCNNNNMRGHVRSRILDSFGKRAYTP